MSYQGFVGIDIGKNEFVVGSNSCKTTKSFSNDDTGHTAFIAEYRSVLSQSLTVLEGTGGYEKELLLRLVENGLAVHRADTRKVKNFIRSFGTFAKTDAIDARALAHYGQERHSRLNLFQLQSKSEEMLRLLVERRIDLTKMLTQEKNRHQAPLNKPLKRSIATVIKCLEKQVAALEEKMDELIAADLELTQKEKILRSVPGIGPITAKSVLALIPELGTLDRKKIASLCGLAPHTKQSGLKTWYTPTRGGRRNVRPILFLSAMAARRSKGTELSRFYENLIANGKKKMVALTAVMRKIVVIANARLRDGFYLKAQNT